MSLSRISRTESKTAPPDMSPFLADVEQLKSELSDLKSHLDDNFITVADFMNRSEDLKTQELPDSQGCAR